MTTLKVCIRCRKSLSLTEFYLKNTKKPVIGVSSFTSRCKACEKTDKKTRWAARTEAERQHVKERQARWYQKHKERISRETKAARAGNYDQWLDKQAKIRLKKAKDRERMLAYRAVLEMPKDKRYLRDRWRVWKTMARKKGREFQITFDDVWSLWSNGPKTCAYTGRPLVLESNSPETVSLDRIDSNLGYTLKNVALCSVIANKMKLDMSVDEFIATAADVAAYAQSHRTVDVM